MGQRHACPPTVRLVRRESVSAIVNTAPNGPRPTSVRYMVLAAVALASTSAYLTRYCISVANTTIEAELGLTPSQMGWVFSAFNIGYLFFQVPGGALGTPGGAP